MPIPDSSRAVVGDVKVRDYLLNLVHPDGDSKAVWLHPLGYTRNDWTYLATDLVAIARNCERFNTEATRFGVKYKASGTIGRDGHRPGLVLTVWMVKDDDPPKLVTAYPDNTKCSLNTHRLFLTPNHRTKSSPAVTLAR